LPARSVEFHLHNLNQSHAYQNCIALLVRESLNVTCLVLSMSHRSGPHFRWARGATVRLAQPAHMIIRSAKTAQKAPGNCRHLFAFSLQAELVCVGWSPLGWGKDKQSAVPAWVGSMAASLRCILQITRSAAAAVWDPTLCGGWMGRGWCGRCTFGMDE
jgi:hypothetical protein